MRIKQYQVDAFAEQAFSGNPAAICPLADWLDDELLQAIAEENNLSETAFFVPSGKGFHLRWFTPVQEVELCGHATLAAAYVLFEILGYTERRVTFATRSGELFVEKKGKFLQMNLPACPFQPQGFSEILTAGLGQAPLAVLAASDYVAVFENEDIVRAIVPDQSLLRQLDLQGVIVTAPGVEVDFVSRFFAPKLGIPEDPVTGSAHCVLAPYWAARLGKNILQARQLSRRGGNILCEISGDRVLLSGQAVLFMEGEIIFSTSAPSAHSEKGK